MTLRGSVASFPLETIIQLIAATAKTGQLEVRSGGESGTLGFAEGHLVSALSGDDTGDPALGAVFTFADGEFEFLPWADPPDANLSGDLNQLLDRAAVQRDRIAADRELIADDRVRFALSERAAAGGEVRLSADQWRTLLAVNGERDLSAIADQLRLGRLGTLAVLADLVRSGIIEATPPPPEPPPVAEPPPAPPAAEPPPSPPAAEPPPVSSWQPPTERSTPVSSWDAPAEPAARSTWEAPAGPARAWDTPATDTRSWDAPAETAPSLEQPARDWDVPAEAMDPWTQTARSDIEEDDRSAPPAVVDGQAEPSPAAETPDSDIDARLAALSGAYGGQTATPAWPAPEPEPEAAPRPLFPAPTEPAASPVARTAEPAPVAAEEPKKRGGLFSGLFKKDEAKAPNEPAGGIAAGRQSGARGTQLAALANGMLDEFKSTEYGKGRVDDRIANLLMRVDEQADPIDRPLPVANDRIDVAALERAGMSEAQIAPYLALLVSQIYEDAEHAFGRDKARRGYKSVQQRVIGDPASLGTDLRLPRV